MELWTAQKGTTYDDPPLDLDSDYFGQDANPQTVGGGGVPSVPPYGSLFSPAANNTWLVPQYPQNG